MDHTEKYLAQKLEERQQAGNLRQLPGDRTGTDFYSNDYLGLAKSGALHTYMPTKPGTGSTGSRLLSGNATATEQLERTIADFHNAEAALLFNSGYDANVGLLSSISHRHTAILYDALCHASILDGTRLSLCRHKARFLHNNVDDLQTLLQQHSGAGPVLVVTESIFSMDGDAAPLVAIAALCQQYGAQLIVDEAHATGVFGARGQGMVCALGLEQQVFARVHTYGKALGCHGAAVVGSGLLRQYLLNFARSFIYTTALPGHSVAAIAGAYSYLSASGFTHAPLHSLIGYFGQRVAESGLTGWQTTASPIQVWLAGSNARAQHMARKIQAAGLLVCPILHPTVPAGKERLRICLHSFNTHDEVDKLVQVMAQPD